MTLVEEDDIKEALAIKEAQKALDVRQMINQGNLKNLVRRSTKSVIRVVLDGKIVTVSASNGGRVIQTHVSDLDATIPNRPSDRPPSGGCALSQRGERL